MVESVRIMKKQYFYFLFLNIKNHDRRFFALSFLVPGFLAPEAQLVAVVSCCDVTSDGSWSTAVALLRLRSTARKNGLPSCCWRCVALSTEPGGLLGTGLRGGLGALTRLCCRTPTNSDWSLMASRRRCRLDASRQPGSPFDAGDCSNKNTVIRI